jgi:hypothetical protein
MTQGMKTYRVPGWPKYEGFTFETLQEYAETEPMIKALVYHVQKLERVLGGLSEFLEYCDLDRSKGSKYDTLRKAAKQLLKYETKVAK